MPAKYIENVKRLLVSKSAWISIILFLLINGFIFAYFNVDNGFVYYGYTISNAIMAYIPVIPILCINAKSRVFKGKKIALDILSGYLAYLTWLMSGVVIFTSYALFLINGNGIPVTEILLSLFGYFVFGAALTAVVLFVNVCTVKKYINIPVSILLMGVFIFSGLVSDSTLITPFDFPTFLNPLINGVFSIPSLVYFISFISLFLYLTVKVINFKSLKETEKKPKGPAEFSHGSFLVLIIVLCLVFINLLVNSIPYRYLHFDLTKESLYTPDEDLISLVKRVDKDIDIIVLNDKKEEDNIIGVLLRQLRESNNHIKVSYVPKEDVTSVMLRYTTEYLPYNSMIITDGNRCTTLNYDDLYIRNTQDYGYFSQYGYFPLEGTVLQEKLAKAISYISYDEHPVVYVSTGLSEYSLSNTLINKLYNESIEVIYVDLEGSEYIPDNVAALIMAGPLYDLSERAYEVIVNYLENGGNAMFMYSTQTDEPLVNYEKLAKRYGITMEDGIVLETQEENYYMCQWYVIPKLMETVITHELIEGMQNVLIMYPKAMLYNKERLEEAVTMEPIIMSSDASFVMQSGRIPEITGPTLNEKADDELQGPFYFGLKATAKIKDKVSSCIFYSSEFLLDDEADAVSLGANHTLFVNSVKDIITYKDTISIEPIIYGYDDIQDFSDGKITLAYVLFAGIIPFLFIFIGTFVSHLILKNDCGKIK